MMQCVPAEVFQDAAGCSREAERMPAQSPETTALIEMRAFMAFMSMRQMTNNHESVLVQTGFSLQM